MKIVIALGGNALGDDPIMQKRNASLTAKYIVPIIKMGHDVIITHGNGPQVGLINLAFEEGRKTNSKVFPMPFSECGAMSQGYISYHLLNAIKEELINQNIDKEIVSVLTHILVDKDDIAFSNPTKFIGSFYKEDEISSLPFRVKKDSNRGYRRVIASPKPLKVVEENAIKKLIENGYLVISCGGGGIPMVSDTNGYHGVDAVIDKDYASAKLASEIDADMLLILTQVDNVCIHFGLPNEFKLKDVSLNEMKEYCNLGEFPSGSMRPKVEACIEFLEEKKNRIAIITSIENAYDAIEFKKGTIIR